MHSKTCINLHKEYKKTFDFQRKSINFKVNDGSNQIYDRFYFLSGEDTEIGLQHKMVSGKN